MIKTVVVKSIIAAVALVSFGIIATMGRAPDSAVNHGAEGSARELAVFISEAASSKRERAALHVETAAHRVATAD